MMPIVRTEERRLYCCDCCGKTEEWNDGWAWYGSYRQLDDEGMKDSKPVMTMCSADCRVKLIAESRLPHEGIDDNGNVVEEKDDAPPSRRRQQHRPVSSHTQNSQGE